MPSPAPEYAEYYPAGWQDLQGGGTPLDAAALNNMENGIKGSLQAPVGPVDGDIPIWDAAANGGAGGWNSTTNKKLAKAMLEALEITNADIAAAAGIDPSKIAGDFPISKLNGYPSDATRFLRGDGTWAEAVDRLATTLQSLAGPLSAPAFGSTYEGAAHALNIAAGVMDAVQYGFHYISTNDGSTVETITDSTGTNGFSYLILRNASASSAVFGNTGNIADAFTLPSTYIALLYKDITEGSKWVCLAISTGSPAQSPADRASTVEQSFSGDIHAPRFRPSGNTALVYGPTVNIDASKGEFFTLGVTNNVAFTIANPTNNPSGSETGRLVIEIFNSTGASITPSWGTEYKGISGAVVAPGLRCSYAFAWNGATSSWVSVGNSFNNY